MWKEDQVLVAFHLQCLQEFLQLAADQLKILVPIYKVEVRVRVLKKMKLKFLQSAVLVLICLFQRINILDLFLKRVLVPRMR